jgi:RTX calcium-binding nonapeptide repeat (4 copies)
LLSGLAFPVPVGGLPGGINPVTWSGNLIDTAPNLSVNWQWAAAVYKNFSSDNNALGVKPLDVATGQYPNSDHTGTPEAYKSSVTGGARGGGGSNYTGSYSGTQKVTPTDPPMGSASAGDGNDTVQLGGGNNVVTLGNGNDYVTAGSGNNLIVAGLGQHPVQAGNGSNILIDGSVSLARSGDSLRQVLSDWTQFGALAANVADIRSRLAVTYNTSHANKLTAGSGLDWFFATYAGDQTNPKAGDLLN